MCASEWSRNATHTVSLMCQQKLIACQTLLTLFLLRDEFRYQYRRSVAIVIINVFYVIYQFKTVKLPR